MSSEKANIEWVPISQADWSQLGDSHIDLKLSNGDISEMNDARQVGRAIRENGGPGHVEAFRKAIRLTPRDSQPGDPTAARWVDSADMPGMPRGWYWAAFPGGWEWYSPDLNMTQGIDHGDVRWHKLMSKRYWGPFVGPPNEVVTDQ